MRRWSLADAPRDYDQIVFKVSMIGKVAYSESVEVASRFPSSWKGEAPEYSGRRKGNCEIDEQGRPMDIDRN